MNAAAGGPFGLRIEPDPGTAIAAMASFRATASGTRVFGRSLADWRRETRAALGLPVDGPLVLTGHQAAIWHPGILAKWFLAAELAGRVGGRAAAIVVDGDTNDGGAIAYPTLADGQPRRAILPTLPSRRGGPTGTARPVRLGPPEREPLPEVAAGLARIAAATNARAGAPNLAAQLAAANDELLADLLAPLPAFPATKLLRLPAARALLEAWREDPAAAATYRAALEAHPRVARALGPAEWPVWRLLPGRRAPVQVGESLDDGPFAPRALLLTAFARLFVGDLFVHGTGGGAYDRAGEAWIRAWLGVEPAPIAVATATLRLELAADPGDADGEPPTVADLRRLAFDPDAGADGPSEGVRNRLAAIGAAPRRSPERRAAYRALLAHRAERAAARSTELAALRARLEGGKARAAARAVTRDRTWPHPLHPPEKLRELRAAIAAACRGDQPPRSGSGR